MTLSRLRPDRNPAAQQSPAAAEVCYPDHRKQGSHRAVKRRNFITLVCGAAATWPLSARTQQRERMRRIGVLMNFAAGDPAGQARLIAFVQGLQHLGWTEGHNAH